MVEFNCFSEACTSFKVLIKKNTNAEKAKAIINKLISKTVNLSPPFYIFSFYSLYSLLIYQYPFNKKGKPIFSIYRHDVAYFRNYEIDLINFIIAIFATYDTTCSCVKSFATSCSHDVAY